MRQGAKSEVFDKTYYALDWPCATHDQMLIKYLHASPDIPFRVAGIIYNDIYIDSIDGISCIATDDFLKMSHKPGAVLLPLRDNREWALLIADSIKKNAPAVKSASDVIRKIADALISQKKYGIPLGPMAFPDVIAQADRLSADYCSLFADDESRNIYRAYLEFLQHPDETSLRVLASPFALNADEGDWFLMSGFDNRDRPPAVIELADAPNSFASQFFNYMGPLARYYIVISPQHHADLSHRKHNIFDPLSPHFYHYMDKINDVPARVWKHPDNVLIINKPLSKKESDFLAERQLSCMRIILSAGYSPGAFAEGLNFLKKVHPNGTYRLRTHGRYPNSLYLFSAGRTHD